MNEQHDFKRPARNPRQGLVRPVRTDPTGRDGPTRGQARGPRWRQSSYGYYVPADVDGTLPEQRIVEQSVRLPGHGAVTGWAACRLHGAAYFDGLERDGRTPRPVPLVVGAATALRDDRGASLARDRIDAHERVILRGIPCTRPQRALFDEMRQAPDERDAVTAMDMMAAAELVSIRQMREYVQGRRGWRGIPQVRRALDLADEGSVSPQETRMRLVWILDAGLPPPLCNQPVFGLRGELLGVADLFDPVAGVVGEYDGAAHRDRRRHRRDVLREDRFREAGLEYFKVVGMDLVDLDLVVDRMVRTRARAAFLPSHRRRWTLEAPAGWHDSPLETMTLDERMEFRSAVHARDVPIDRVG